MFPSFFFFFSTKEMLVKLQKKIHFSTFSILNTYLIFELIKMLF